jgi:hypothetical protein
MYKGASQNLQHAARPRSLADLTVASAEGLTHNDRIDALKRRIKQVSEEIERAPNKAERRRLGLLKAHLCEERRQLGFRRTKQDLSNHFVTVVKERVPPALFAAYMNAARALAVKEQETSERRP